MSNKNPIEITLLSNVELPIPNVKELGALYQRAIDKKHLSTATAAENAVLAVGRGEAALAEARNLATFLDAV
jgi:hypothetical protein